MKRARHISILFSIILLFCFGTQWKVIAQDIHFSQFTLAPLTTNPALAGFYSGDHRAFLNYKNQWNGMAARGAAYRTFMCSYDTRILTKKFKNGYIGTGFNAFRDVAGDLNLGTTQFNISFSGIVSINSRQLISGGIQGGFVQKSISSSAMKWDSQYNNETGAYDPSMPSNDVYTIAPKMYGDFSAGVAWNYNANKSTTYSREQMRFNAGIAAFHLNRPNQKFKIYNNDIDPLSTKFVIHGSGYIGIGAKGYQLLPSFIFFKQGPHTEFDIGAMARWVIQAESKYTGYVKGMALAVGAQYRAKDAIIPMVLYEYSDFGLGVSYDINTSSLIRGTRGKGGIEFALRYVKPIGISSTRLLD
jgi:type IX secretion system PorP/SprF family membrane protein